MKRIIAFLLTGLSAALLVVPALPHFRRPAIYAASGRTLNLPAVALPNGTVSVNMGDPEELDELPGVGETLAAAIMDERARGGPFFYPEDLTAVRGIGAKTVAGFRDLLDMTVPPEDGAEGDSPLP